MSKIVIAEEWVGFIFEILDDNTFNAKIFSKSKISNVYEIGTFSLDEFSNEDRLLIKKGSVFNWTIGCENGKKFSIINLL